MADEPKIEPSTVGLRIQLVVLAAGCLVSVMMISKLDKIHADRIDELTVGQLTTGLANEDNQLLCVDLKTCKASLTDHQGWQGDTILWLGNSQLPTINQQQPGDRTMVELLHHRLLKDNQYVIGFAPPNANLQEHYVLLEYLADKIKPTTLLLPVFFDDLRETGVRLQLADAFADPDTVQSLRKTEIGRSLLEQSRATELSSRAVNKLPTSTMDQCEAAIDSWLSSKWHAWEQRGTYRSVLFVKLHHLRNEFLQVNPQSVRRMIPARYDRNMESLDAIVASCKERNINLLLYIPPIRTDVPIPYDITAYESFKKMLREYANKHQLIFADYENVVAAAEWGTKVSSSLVGGQELDFMHFSFPGHQKLARKIEETLRRELPALGGSAGDHN